MFIFQLLSYTVSSSNKFNSFISHSHTAILHTLVNPRSFSVVVSVVMNPNAILILERTQVLFDCGVCIRIYAFYCKNTLFL